MKVLLIEDDRRTAEYVCLGLRENGYVVDHAEDGKQGFFLAEEESYDAIIVDRM